MAWQCGENDVGMEKILILQKKGVRIIMNAESLESCWPLFIQAKVLTAVN